ncbi:MAG: hypothetical protein RMZ41_003430 [Nostoc sp. DedVER02]|nr:MULTISPECIES: hypothetical protein [unclassified Nostoc]MDZ7986791.1 hypothetical protein [Nostoc sp. DedVER02]MDZ8115693.1 hypothetical protein [Nostoc sp. DedVER01b]
MLNYQLGACTTGEEKVGTLSPQRRSRAVSLRSVMELFNQTIEKL